MLVLIKQNYLNEFV